MEGGVGTQGGSREWVKGVGERTGRGRGREGLGACREGVERCDNLQIPKISNFGLPS